MPPPVAEHVFRDTLPVAEQYAALLATSAVTRGLIGPREVPQLWERHLINCALLGNAVEHGSLVCDIGSGAGLPGLVLGLRRPDLTVTLVEPLLRRSRFLEEAVAALGLANVEVVRARAEQLHGRRSFPVVTARAVAPLTRLVPWVMPLVGPGGALVAMKGAKVWAEVEAATMAGVLDGFLTSVTEYGADIINPPTTALRVESVRAAR